ncbi:MAG: RNA 3'-terminal phosphate cyclase [Spirochaetes bacterium]|nr:RNA 3'-terminal phosphate cyclase [Spirochaetota bacterium]
MITIDGSFGEGGGQIIRSCLGLSLLTGKEFKINNIRAGREKPGLLRQHLTAANAAVSLSDADVYGNELGSRELYFKPGKVKPGTYKFSVGTAGSLTLVLQTILPALLTAGQESVITLEGGTHNSFAPSFDFLENSFFKILKNMGVAIESEIEQYGFYPAGGGRAVIRINSVPDLKPLFLTERKKILKISATAVFSRISAEIAKKELNIVKGKFNLESSDCRVREVNSPGPGNVLLLEMESETVTEVITSFGEKNISSEKVAENAVSEAEKYIKAEVPVGEHLADQLIIPICMAGKGAFRTMKPSLHTLTNIEVVKKFIDISIQVTEVNGKEWEIKIGD